MDKGGRLAALAILGIMAAWILATGPAVVLGIEKRHDPLLPPQYLYLDSGEVKKLIGRLRGDAARLGEAYARPLALMNEALDKWDGDLYSGAAATLEQQLLSPGGSLGTLEEDDLKAMALLASSELARQPGLVKVDLTAYSRLLRILAEQGALAEDAEKLGDTEYLENKIIEGDLGINTRISSEATPTDPQRIEEMIAGLLDNPNISSTELGEVLSGMEEALRRGDYERYGELAQRLGDLVEEQETSAGLDEETLKELSYLASTGSAEGAIVFDPEKYVRLIEALSRSGLLDLLIPWDSSGNPLIDEELLRKILPRSVAGTEEIELGELLGGSEENPLDALEEFSANGSLPDFTVPRLGAGRLAGPAGIMRPPSASARSLTFFVGLPLIGVVAALLIAKERRLVMRAVSSIRWRVESRLMARRLEGPPRTRVIRCFEMLVAAMARKGYPKEEWETHREYSNRMLGTRFGEPVRDASRLYEVARYSTRPVGDEDASMCMRCLERLDKA